MNIDLSDKEIEFLIRALVKNYAEEQSDFKENDIADYGISNLLIGKLVSRSNKNDCYDLARQARYIENKLDKKLFMGCGNVSTVRKNDLHCRLEFAVSCLSAIEQNGGMGTEFDEAMDKECRQGIADVIDDMKIAFGIKDDK